ncbi:DUF3280 domain-containing protein [Methylobacterium isbiliense]|jgi:hypothetical protein|uniref:DUF2380 domain-containing protein n=1 Tax=Methylobacterium isbiliense TaxID=315478 RepID=A0ABQ4SKX8_9HYPH|nr:DUF3280 domain-containing protein [Methylobacterium isbiliense]MDN3622902.1 DUF3280 domain-containing protein [Methylobacterium isbiliense]GJE02405.1 hypothetical protein GMJLKIPL_4353 [Methylobacterium isbiliense]
MLPARLLPALAALLLPGMAAAAPEKAAVFGIELLEPGVVGGRLPRPDEARRLALATEELRKAVAVQGQLEFVDLAPKAADIRKDAPLYKCEGCAERIAKEAGAALAVYGYVQRNANQILNLSITISDTDSGKVLRGGQVVIRGDTDDTWLHGVRWLVKNRLFAEPLPSRS